MHGGSPGRGAVCRRIATPSDDLNGCSLSSKITCWWFNFNLGLFVLVLWLFSFVLK